MYEFKDSQGVHQITDGHMDLVLEEMGVEFAHCSSTSGCHWIAFDLPEKGGVVHPLACGPHNCTIHGAGLDGLLSACRAILQVEEHPHSVEERTPEAVAAAVLSNQPKVLEALAKLRNGKPIVL